MMYLQQNLPKANQIHNLSLSDFSGGLNNVRDILNDDESPDMLNMVYTSNDILSKRNGQKFANGDDYTDAITFIDEYVGSGPVNTGSRWGSAVWGDISFNSTSNLVVATDKDRKSVV